MKKKIIKCVILSFFSYPIGIIFAVLMSYIRLLFPVMIRSFISKEDIIVSTVITINTIVLICAGYIITTK
ncbi:hypothetical protein [Anaerocolumna sp. MB42-C2]|uniref:hypothetical protein n=1 Tax=Anaerocolumna sp. MB42-C2 TaxID=3070997 RepID=UPI0027E0ED62|nr:hypothetical protein [Anaerocolumna sp. MB42-C2]WMJ85488.1 hypothetical protein RBU59_15565 [Anaerocolumna sp. MB42-C2]